MDNDATTLESVEINGETWVPKAVADEALAEAAQLRESLRVIRACVLTEANRT